MHGFHRALVDQEAEQWNGVGGDVKQPWRPSSAQQPEVELVKIKVPAAVAATSVSTPVSVGAAAGMAMDHEILSFETDKDGNLSLDKVSVFIKGVLALKYKMADNVWRIVSMEGDVLQKPQDGWTHRVYTPINSSLQHQCEFI